MAYVMGEQVQLGLGVEGTRGTKVAPQSWIPARTPTGITTVVEKTLIRETRGSGISSQGSEIVKTFAEGDLEFNLRSTSIGYILKSLLGTVSSTTADAATTHVFTRQTTGPQNPSLTLGLSQKGNQDYSYALGVVNSLEIRTPLDDVVNATASFMATVETEESDYTPAFDADEDFLFRNHDVTVKFAAEVGDLDAATGVCINELALTVSNSARDKQCIGSKTPADIFTLISEISGSFTADFNDPADYYDLFKAGTYKAMRIDMVRSDLSVIGTSALKPRIVIDLPKVSFDGYSPDRPIDDIVTESIDFNAHYDDTEASAISVTIINDTGNYNAA